MATPRTVPWPCFKIHIDRFPTGQPNPIDRLINPRPGFDRITSGQWCSHDREATLLDRSHTATGRERMSKILPTGLRPSIDRFATDNNQPLGEREWRKCARPDLDRGSTDTWPVDLLPRPVTHSYWKREKMTTAIATGDQPAEVLRSTGRYIWRAFLRPIELLLTLFFLWKNRCFVFNYW